ncbi:hypothetical protein NEIFLAOT_00099 [Neisseria flavescens NRL30031/H210]|uniref:Uncharacterized protein n=1 Tax=Neisseria flavescens NRL30031/H210 TaxID=546264 RepID=C0EJL1_NEIFL|nr:hypothetical protein NEIFLAOT_00099 [Neisseria flavescens NRL30031/H210]
MVWDIFNSRIGLERYSGLNLNQDKATKPQTVQIVRQGEATPYWFKFNPLYYFTLAFCFLHTKYSGRLKIAFQTA